MQSVSNISGGIKLTLCDAVLVFLASLVGPARADDIIVSKAYFEDPTGALPFSEIKNQNYTRYEGAFSKGLHEKMFSSKKLHKNKFSPYSYLSQKQ